MDITRHLLERVDAYVSDHLWRIVIRGMMEKVTVKIIYLSITLLNNMVINDHM